MIYEKCKTCKHCVQYYVLKEQNFRLAIGHCKNSKATKHTRNFLNLVEDCNYWEENTDTPNYNYRVKSAQEAIFEINERLNQIVKILELDENKE